VAPLWADLSDIKAEPRPDRRAEKALDYANEAFKAAQEAYLVKGDLTEANGQLHQLSASVEIAYAALKETGKNPHKSPKNFKRAEIRTRELLRRLLDFREQMSALDRDEVDNVRSAVQKVHDDLLAGIMGEKKLD
jgi:hypothetical protein